MIASTTDVSPAALAAYDDIIDVRSPAEFAEDHVPGAISLPVLSNEERAEVGTIYVKVSRFLARRIGAAHVARNIARHLDEALDDRPGDYAPLVYCWRGGQRSTAMATVMDQVGWRPTVLQGGYKTWRRRVTRCLYDGEPDLDVVLLDGDTGVAKTEVLQRLGALGVQSLDLEDLAAHRGSLFGALSDRPQPTQKGFESALVGRLDRLDRSKPVVVEAESSKVGELNLPPRLWKAMLCAQRIEIVAPRAARAAYLVHAYGDIVADPNGLRAILARLPAHISKDRQDLWRALAASGEWRQLAASLIEHHYDPAYARSRRRETRPCLQTIVLADLEPGDLDLAARRIAERLADLPPVRTGATPMTAPAI